MVGHHSSEASYARSTHASSSRGALVACKRQSAGQLLPQGASRGIRDLPVLRQQVGKEATPSQVVTTVPSHSAPLICLRDAMSSFANTLRRCHSTVCGLMKS